MNSKTYLVKNIINDIVVYNSKNNTILQSCSNLGIEIPRYCYHNRLSIAGNCRMCLVEIYGVEKPVVACAQLGSNNLHILTNSELVKRMREGISKFLLYNHPLDCAICDQGGECDLQDQVMVYGADKSRYYDYKRTVLDKECGPLIKTIMTRCIHCTRCVRFLDEVAGSSTLGVLGRGQSMEIGTYLDEFISSEISGNIIDLCPVGALTSKPSAFRFRSWELRSVESLDLFDSVHSNIMVDVACSDIMRITPIINNLVNEEWIHDKVRFSYDGLVYNRLGTPLKRIGTSLVSVDWKTVISEFKVLFFNNLCYKNNFIFNFSSTENVNDLYLFNLLSKIMNNSYISHENYDVSYDYDFLMDYGLKVDLSVLDRFDDYVLIGHNFRLESPIINLKLRRSVITNNSKVYYFGSVCDITYAYFHNGISIKSFYNWISKGDFTGNKKCLVLVNRLYVTSNIIDVIKNLILKNKLNWELSCFNNLANSIGICNYGSFTSVYSHYNSMIYYKNILNKVFYRSTLFNFNFKAFNKNIFYFLNTVDTYNKLYEYKSHYDYIIYQGHTGNSILLENVDLVLPSSTYMEDSSSYFNVNNKIQKTQVVFDSPRNVRKTSIILKLLIKIWNILSCSYDKTKIVRLGDNNLSMFNIGLDTKLLSSNTRFYSIKSKLLKNNLKYFMFNSNILLPLKDDFYNTNLVTLSSKIMSSCSNNLKMYSNYVVKS